MGTRVMNEVQELEHHEIELINGAGKIDPPNSQTVDYPEIDNNPPVPPA